MFSTSLAPQTQKRQKFSGPRGGGFSREGGNLELTKKKTRAPPNQYKAVFAGRRGILKRGEKDSMELNGHVRNDETSYMIDRDI